MGNSDVYFSVTLVKISSSWDKSVTNTARRQKQILVSFVHPGTMTMRWRGLTMRGMNVFPNTDPAHLAFTEDAIRNEMEDGERP